ncbi:MAG: hypothetical protein ACRDCB_06040 [Clostridium sp.]|uniref:hypothetical protein n=1 Tax=Clostridium sp. TaxID=1506 RepID=UPI003EE51029
MKYTVHGLQQEKLIELGLDNDDALILSVIKDMYSSASIEYEIIEGDRYIWLNQSNLAKQIPIVGSLRKIQSCIKNIEDIGLIKRKVLFRKLDTRKNIVVKGKFSFVSLTKRFDYITEYDHMKSVRSPYEGVSEPLMNNLRNKDSSIKHSPVIDSIYNYFLSKKIIKSKEMTLKTVKSIEKALLKYSESDIKKAIDNYKVVLDDNEYFFTQRWGIEAFLNKSNGLEHFTLDGEKWINYLEYKNKKYRGEQIGDKFNCDKPGFREHKKEVTERKTIRF